MSENMQQWKPTRGYVAVEPLTQRTGAVKVGSVFLSQQLVKATLRGRVLAIGEGVRELQVGDMVAYERQSAHQHQTSPIPAGYFGGEEGKFAVLVPAGRYAEDTSSTDTELLKRKAALEELKQTWRNKAVPKDVQWQAEKHAYEIERLHAKKRRGGRTKAFTRSDQAGKVVNQGIVAVISQEEEGSEDE